MISQAQQKFFAWLIDPKRVTAKGPPPKDPDDDDDDEEDDAEEKEPAPIREPDE